MPQRRNGAAALNAEAALEKKRHGATLFLVVLYFSSFFSLNFGSILICWLLILIFFYFDLKTTSKQVKSNIISHNLRE